MNGILRLPSLALALVVTLALLAATTTPARAQAPADVRASQSQATGSLAPAADHGVAALTVKAQPRSTHAPRTEGHVKPFGHHVSYMGNDYCGGWIHGPAWCLTFNKVEAGYLSAVSLSVAAAFICGATALVTCAAAVGIAAAIQRYVDHNGVCPKSHPKMRVEYFPHPGLVSCD
jgi:hypothetical protein